MKKINNIFALLFLAEGLFFLYSFVLILNKVLSVFNTDAVFLYTYSVYIATTILFIVAGIGLWKNKNSAIVCAFVAVLLPQLLKLIVPSARIPLENNYFILILNILVLVYLSTRGKK